jgi:hypothetical protein
VRGNTDIPSDLLINELVVPAGSELIFNEQRAEFRIRDFRVEGTVRIGGPDCRIRKNINFVFDTDEDITNPEVREDIFAREGLGLVVAPSGVFEAYGKLYQPTWTRLAATVNPGDTTVRLAERVDWTKGQSVVLVTSARRDLPFTNQNEIRKIASRPNARTLVLNSPVEYLHYGGDEYQVEVGLLTRKIEFRTAFALRQAEPRFGGHLMVHGGEARISGVEFLFLGQRNFLGRYPVHFHHMGDTAGNSFLTDSAIVHSNWRCAVLHRTDNAVISRNVAFNTRGHCFYLEDGIEQGNEISYNLAAAVKILGPVDRASLEALDDPTQTGFTLNESAAMVNPADRAASGFYIPNGNNFIFGNAASGGFAGYSFPLLPEVLGGGHEGVRPLETPISYFDGNTAHSSAYFWRDSGCVYVGGVLEYVDVGGEQKLQYRSGRSLSPYLRQGTDYFSNTKTFLCASGIVHWGHNSRVLNLEAWDVGFMAQLFGSASVQSTLVAGHTGHTDNLPWPPWNWHQRGFRFYDTDTRTNLRGVVFRNFQSDPNPGARRSQNNCAMITTSHSDQFTPQRMSSVAEFYFANVDHAQRFCHDDTGTLASRNFNINDMDGSATAVAGDGLPAGQRIVGSGHSDIWAMNYECIHDDEWGLWICPQTGNQNVASIATFPNDGVRVEMYQLNGDSIGDNWYSSAHYEQAQITGPSGIGWHHVFPNANPASFEVHAKQVPEGSFVLYSLTLEANQLCSVTSAGWSEVENHATLLTRTDPVYANDSGHCLIRIPPANQGHFVAAGLSTPFQTGRNSSSLSSFIVNLD